MGVLAYGATCTGSSGVNGDAFYISPDQKVFLLADGASGAGSDGKVLMARTCVEIARQFDYAASGLNAMEYVDELFRRINGRLIELSQERRALVYGTLDIAVVDGGVATVTTLGDSPAFFYDGGQAKRIARNQKRYEWMIDAGYITREQYEGYIRQMHEMMWCCFDFFVPEVVPNNVIEQYPMGAGCMLVLCCDGMSDWVPAEEIIKTLAEQGIREGVEGLIGRAREAALDAQKHFDDITAVAIRQI